MLRILLGVNLGALAAALVRSRGIGDWIGQYVEMAAWVQPLLIADLALLGIHHDVFASEAEIPFKDNRPKVFSAADRPRPVQVFREDEKGKMCRYCAEYVVNPFLQRCALHKCEVEATDTCPHFRPKPEPPPAAAEPDAPNPLRL